MRWYTAFVLTLFATQIWTPPQWCSWHPRSFGSFPSLTWPSWGWLSHNLGQECALPHSSPLSHLETSLASFVGFSPDPAPPRNSSITCLENQKSTTVLCLHVTIISSGNLTCLPGSAFSSQLSPVGLEGLVVSCVLHNLTEVVAFWYVGLRYVL